MMVVNHQEIKVARESDGRMRKQNNPAQEHCREQVSVSAGTLVHAAGTGPGLLLSEAHCGSVPRRLHAHSTGYRFTLLGAGRSSRSISGSQAPFRKKMNSFIRGCFSVILSE